MRILGLVLGAGFFAFGWYCAGRLYHRLKARLTRDSTEGTP